MFRYFLRYAKDGEIIGYERAPDHLGPEDLGDNVLEIPEEFFSREVEDRFEEFRVSFKISPKTRKLRRVKR